MARIQERLPLPEFRDYDDRVAILWKGLAGISTLGMNPLDVAQSLPYEVMPRICKEISSAAPDDTVLSDPKKVQQIFNILALAGKLGTIPFIPIDNRGNL